METVSIRKHLHDYVDNGDEKLLRLMYALAREYNDEDDFENELSEADIKMFDKRRTKRLNGESKTYNWQQAKKIVTGKRNME
jgi:phosphoribosylanthranilate isomerase